MATFKISDVRSAGRAASSMQKTASIMLNEAVREQTTTKTYDIFLSHAFKDAELILGVKVKLEGYGHSVYVDWVDDPQLDRSAVTPETAATLRQRMACCRSLFYSTTEASSNSKWMPWECGYVDGSRHNWDCDCNHQLCFWHNHSSKVSPDKLYNRSRSSFRQHICI